LASILKKEKRNVIPRWRSFKETLALGELSGSPRADPRAFPGSNHLMRLQWEWSQNHTIWHAADFVGAASILHSPDIAKNAADYLLTHSNCPAAARSLAYRYLNQETKRSEAQSCSAQEDFEELYAGIHRSRLRLQEDPRNAIQWIDLARQYTVLGLEKQASRAVTIATTLGKNNRFILRSASRFYVHKGEVDRAHALLLGGESTRRDPWLLAAEIALAATAELPPRFATLGRRALDDESINPQHLTELASELATLELSSGKMRNAKKLFRRALASPNENSLAQAEWAWEKLSGETLNVDEFKVPYNFEAQAWHSYQFGEWEEALRNSRCWLVDQPFSRRPAILASYVASSMLEDYETSIDLIERSLLPNPHDPILLNNLAFAYANLGRVRDAQVALNNADLSQANPTEKICLMATQGLVCFRQARAEEGRRFYREALKRAVELKDIRVYTEALLHLAFEEIRAGSDEAKESVAKASEAASKHNERSVKLLLKKLQQRSSQYAKV
jgi:cytochrome c-type biogenesis protein CcmH/NrfG